MAFVHFCAPGTLRAQQTRQRSSCAPRAVRFSSTFVPAHTPARLCFHPAHLAAHVARPSMSASAPPRIVIVGAPASGKGTQCASILKTYGVVHISTGDMLREAVAAGSPLGRSAQKFMDEGRLVPDEVVTAMLVERLAQPDCETRGWLLDGFPRTAAQADALYAAEVSPDAVVVLDVPDEVLVQRVVGRRMDPETGAIYHLAFNPPADDAVRERLVQRSDDNEEKALVRLDTFKKHSEAVEGRYASKLVRVDGNRSKDVVFADLRSKIDAALAALRGDDEGGSGGGGAAAAGVSAAGVSAEAATDASTATSMPVSEFVRRAEEAYERGVLEASDVNWSGQAGVDKLGADGSRNWGDILQRSDLAIGDALAFLLFAYIGRASHGSPIPDKAVLATAAPFIAAWFALAPLTGAYTRSATRNFSAAVVSLLPAWALAVPAGLGVRGVSEYRPASMCA